MSDIDIEDLPQTLVNILHKRNCLNSLDLAEEFKVDHQKIIGGIKSLQTHSNVSS